MDAFPPKARSIFSIVICLLASIIIRLLTDLNIVIIIDIIIFIPGFILSLILSTQIDIRASDILFYVIALCSLFVVTNFNKSDLALNLSIKDWEKTVTKRIGDNCTTECKINGRVIYASDKRDIYNWHGLSYVYDGYIIKVDNSLEYKISLDDKCIVKKANEKYRILNGRCK